MILTFIKRPFNQKGLTHLVVSDPHPTLFSTKFFAWLFIADLWHGKEGEARQLHVLLKNKARNTAAKSLGKSWVLTLSAFLTRKLILQMRSVLFSYLEKGHLWTSEFICRCGYLFWCLQRKRSSSGNLALGEPELEVALAVAQFWRTPWNLTLTQC